MYILYMEIQQIDIANKIKELRINLGLSQEKFAQKLGVTRQKIAEYETRTMPKADFILKLQDLEARHKENIKRL